MVVGPVARMGQTAVLTNLLHGELHARQLGRRVLDGQRVQTRTEDQLAVLCQDHCCCSESSKHSIVNILYIYNFFDDKESTVQSTVPRILDLQSWPTVVVGRLLEMDLDHTK
jgi:hypothetical protein